LSRRFDIANAALRGTTAIVTGATSGIGRETARSLARLGANVILSGRREPLGLQAVSEIEEESPGVAASFEPLDLADLSDVADFAGRIAAKHPAVDILVNNAGLLAVPTRLLTKDGFELQFGTNFLGHFALTAHLLPNLIRARNARVVSLSSLSHHAGRLALDDLQAERGYRPWKAYSQSKLAMLSFAIELQRRSDRLHWGPNAGPNIGAKSKPISQRVMAFALRIAGQSAAAGAQPTVAAAAANDIKGGSYLGPAGFLELRGPPTIAQRSERGKNPQAAADLWRKAEILTGVRFPDKPADCQGV
jgi:NAD(P)-dependent dehydrogenase (short-subunit alcohol dehydrogenase family)